MNLLHFISSLFVWTTIYVAAENDPRNYDGSMRYKRFDSGRYQPNYYYPNSNYYPQSNYNPSRYDSPYRSSYYPSSYQSQQPSKYYYYPQKAVVPQTPGNVIKSIISRHDGPLNPYGYKKPNYGPTDRPRKKKKKLFVANVWG